MPCTWWGWRLRWATHMDGCKVSNGKVGVYRFAIKTSTDINQQGMNTGTG
jgi:hypothetical protein